MRNNFKISDGLGHQILLNDSPTLVRASADGINKIIFTTHLVIRVTRVLLVVQIIPQTPR